MQVNFLKTVASSIVGSSGAAAIDLLHDKKNVNEFLIAKKLKLTINQTRNILYKLSDEGLVGFVRKKDAKKGGWYTYFWTLNPGKGLAKYKEILTKEAQEIKNRMSIKKNSKFFICKNCHLEFDEEHALNHAYSCPECGEVLDVKDTSAEVASMEKDVLKLETILQKIDTEIGLVNIENEKIKIKKQKVEDQRKKKEREAKKKAREKEAKKIIRKNPKSNKNSKLARGGKAKNAKAKKR